METLNQILFRVILWLNMTFGWELVSQVLEQTALYGINMTILLGMHNNSTCGLHEHGLRKWTKCQKDTKQSSKTQTAASTSHGRLGFNWLQSKLLTNILHTPTDWQPKITLLGNITSIHEDYWYVSLFLSNSFIPLSFTGKVHYHLLDIESLTYFLHTKKSWFICSL